MALDDVVNLTITVESRFPTQAGFGTPLLAGYHTAWLSDFVREYSKPADLLDDGFTVNDHVYKMALACKSQNPSPTSFKVGRLQTAYTHTVNLTPTITTTGHIYTWTIAGHSGSYTVPASSTVQTIVEAIKPTIDAYAEVICTEDDTKLVVTAATAGKIIEFTVGRGFTVADVTTAGSIASDLAAIIDEDSDWYGLVTDVNSETSIALVAAWVEATRKLYIPMSSDSIVIDSGSTTDVASDLVNSAYARSGGAWHHQIGTWENAAWMGKMLPYIPGSESWVNKTLAGIPASPLKTGHETALRNKRFTGYLAIGGQNVTNPNGGGKTASGEWIDVIRGIDWTYARIQERVFGAMLGPPKIPYTDAGVDIIRAAILSVLREGVTNGLYAADPAPSVSAPKVSTIDKSFKAARVLPGVSFAATLAGAIHLTQITGTVQV